LERFGRLDVLVLNAGVNAHFKFDELEDLDIVEDLMRTNYYANVYLTRFAVQHLKKSAGQVLVVSSMSGKVGTPQRSAYCASKFALGGFFDALRTEDLGIDITVVYPPSLDTPMRSHDILALKHPEHSHPLK
jgi:NAD(P)-dependent dehydrogenase (short-subunit alcohol dehydrogenase family)